MSTAPVPQKHSPGRPSPYDPETYPNLARNYCLLGATNAQLADLLDVSISSIEAWIRDHEEFRHAVKKGRVLADAAVAESLYQRALSGDVGAICFWLKNRRPDKWRDRHDYKVDTTTEVRDGPFDKEKLREASEEDLQTMQLLIKKFTIQ